MKLFKNILLLGIVSFSSVTFSMDVKTLLNKVQEKHKGRLSSDIKYEIFKGHSSSVPSSSQIGFFVSRDGLAYQKINQSEFIYGKDFSLQISHREKIMVLSQASKLNYGNVDFALIEKESSSQKLEEKDGFYFITIILKATSVVPCSKIIYKINKKKYYLVQADFYYSVQEDFATKFNETDLHYPHLRISFSNIDITPNWNEELTNFSTYFSTVQNIIKPKGRLVNYRLIDQRLK